MVLEGNDLSSIAKYISSPKCKNVFLMVGAGISTSAGIPDFRSPETGLYANLARLKLPYPEAVFEIHYFRNNPLPFYTLANELYPGRFRPTITHSFIRLLHSHSLLHTCFTQNIDTLERRAGIPGDKIVEAHGSFASQKCIDCWIPYDDIAMKQNIKDCIIPTCRDCGGLVKPDIVFFGEALPPRFSECAPTLREADLLICIGTSLTVYPFASLAGMIPRDCPRLLINLDRVGDFGRKVNDVVCLGKCDDVVRKLCKELGWEDELMKAWEETRELVEPTVDEVKGKTREDVEGNKPGDDKALDEVERLASKMEKSLALHGVMASSPAEGKNVSGTSAAAEPSPDSTPRKQDVNEEQEKSSISKERETNRTEEIAELQREEPNLVSPANLKL